MIWLRLAMANLRAAPLTATVNALLLALGTASITLLLLGSSQLANTMSRDAAGIDLVIGAKGSPVQLILASVYHADTPTGNIPLADVARWRDDSRVQRAIPLSLGDSFEGFRIVGTSADLVALYDGNVQNGKLFHEPMEATIGAAVAQQTGLSVGSSFAGVHGFVPGFATHDNKAYNVVGLLAPTGTVLDRLILTSLDSVWLLHSNEPPVRSFAEQLKRLPNFVKPLGDEAHDANREITALLLTYRTPLAALSMPREVNATSSLQAAAPAVEITRLLSLVGTGVDSLRAFAWVLVVTAGLSLFAALYGSLRARRFELAMLRCLGATRTELFRGLLLEGLLLTGAGILLGLLGGHLAMELLGQWLGESRGVVLSGRVWAESEFTLVLVLLGVGTLASAIPAAEVYRQDVASTLAEG